MKTTLSVDPVLAARRRMAKKVAKPTPQNPADDTRRNRLKTRRDIAALEARVTALEIETWRDTLKLEARVTALEEWRGRGNVRDNPPPPPTKYD